MNPCFLGTYSVGNQSQCTACPVNYACNSTTPTLCGQNQIANKGDGFCSYYLGNYKTEVITNDVITFIECDVG